MNLVTKWEFMVTQGPGGFNRNGAGAKPPSWAYFHRRKGGLVPCRGAAEGGPVSSGFRRGACLAGDAPQGAERGNHDGDVKRIDRRCAGP